MAIPRVIVGQLVRSFEDDEQKPVCMACFADPEQVSVQRLNRNEAEPLYDPAPEGIYFGRDLPSSEFYGYPCFCCGVSVRRPRPDEPVGPFPSEPAPGSAEAVAQAAETIRGFTSGPWRVEDPLGPGILSIVAGPSYPGEWLDIAQVPVECETTGISAEEAVANARLITAAPDLLAEVVYLRTKTANLQEGIKDRAESERYWKAAAERALTGLDRQHALAAEGSKKRDALADALPPLLALIEDRFTGASAAWKGEARAALAVGREALRKAGR
jgi:hypothetical protein